MSQDNNVKLPAAKKTKLAAEDEEDGHAVIKEKLTAEDVLEIIKASKKISLPPKSAEKPIRKHETVVIDFVTQSGCAEVMIKQAPLSESELKLCEWMKVHPHDNFQCMMQILFHRTVCMNEDCHDDEYREDVVRNMERMVKKYIDEYKDELAGKDAKQIPFTVEELVQIMYDIASGSKQWARCDEMDTINRFKTDERALCMTMTSWC